MTRRGPISLIVALLLLSAAQAQTERPKANGRRAKEFIAAFNKRDAKALAAFWVPDGTLVDDSGREMKGRTAIENHFEGAFAARKGAKLQIIVKASKQVTADVAIEDGIIEVTAEGMAPNVAQFMAVMVKKNDEWYFQTVREMPAEAPSQAKNFEQLEWLIGQWSGENAKGDTLTTSYEFAENGNFIVSSFAISVKGVPLVGGTQWVAWDPIDKLIRSWTFYSGGGFGQAVWARDGKKWTLDVAAKTADGKKVTATNVLTQLSADQCTWQVTNLIVDGKAIPDAPIVKLKRSTAKQEAAR